MLVEKDPAFGSDATDVEFWQRASAGCVFR
jgi:hypothetical protein